jgi:transcriptional regulator with XRE-family HTH domain
MAGSMQLMQLLDMRWTPTEHREVVGRSFMIAREALGMKPSDFAKRLKISQSALWNIEQGGVYPAPIVIVRACEEFSLSADWFLRGERGGLPRELADKLHAAEERLSEEDSPSE